MADPVVTPVAPTPTAAQAQAAVSLFEAQPRKAWDLTLEAIDRDRLTGHHAGRISVEAAADIGVDTYLNTLKAMDVADGSPDGMIPPLTVTAVLPNGTERTLTLPQITLGDMAKRREVVRAAGLAHIKADYDKNHDGFIRFDELPPAPSTPAVPLQTQLQSVIAK